MDVRGVAKEEGREVGALLLNIKGKRGFLGKRLRHVVFLFVYLSVVFDPFIDLRIQSRLCLASLTKPLQLNHKQGFLLLRPETIRELIVQDFYLTRVERIGGAFVFAYDGPLSAASAKGV